MQPNADLRHRLSDHSEDGVVTDSKTVIDDILEYAQQKGISKEQLGKALSEQLSAADSTLYTPTEGRTQLAPEPAKTNSVHLSTASVLFYIGGILLFVGVMFGIYRDGDATNSFSVAIKLGIMGVLFWLLAFMLFRKRVTDTDTVKSGLGDAALLTGSLFLFVCAGQSVFITGDNITATRTIIAIGTLWLTVLALVHYAFDRVVHRFVTISLAALAAIAAFHGLLWTALLDARNTTIYTLMVALTGVYTFLIGTVFKNGEVSRRGLAKPFHSLGGFIFLSSFYSLMLTGSHEIFWTLAFPSLIYSAFMYSIRSRSKTLLTTGSLFLIVYVATVIAKYFAEGLGPAVAFIVAAFAITCSAAFSLYIRKKYFS